MLFESNCALRSCKHYQGVGGPDDTEIGECHICAAFPDGIPNEICNGDNPHTEPFPDDHGIRFEEGAYFTKSPFDDESEYEDDEDDD